VAVIAFKAALTLELSRRENDQKIRALYIKMQDMMSVLRLYFFISFSKLLIKPLTETCRLKDMSSDEDKETVKNRMYQRLQDIAITIEHCAKLCDHYQTKHPIGFYRNSSAMTTDSCPILVKFATSPKWKDKLMDFANTFEEHKKNLQFDLQIQGAATVTETKGLVKDLMALVFEHMCSQQERDLAAFVNSKGGFTKITDDDALLGEALASIESKSGPAATGSRQADVSLHILRQEINMGPEGLSREDVNAFEQKWYTVKDKLTEMKQDIRRESDRVIEAVQSGSHDRIVDRVNISYVS
jgi:hypothetical protein